MTPLTMAANAAAEAAAAAAAAGVPGAPDCTLRESAPTRKAMACAAVVAAAPATGVDDVGPRVTAALGPCTGEAAKGPVGVLSRTA